MSAADLNAKTLKSGLLKLVTAQETADHLGVDVGALLALIHQGILPKPISRRGKRWFLLSQVEEYLNRAAAGGEKSGN